MKSQEKDQLEAYLQELGEARLEKIEVFKATGATNITIDERMFNCLVAQYQSWYYSPEHLAQHDNADKAELRKAGLATHGFYIVKDGQFVPNPLYKERLSQFSTIVLTKKDGSFRCAWLSYKLMCNDLGIEGVKFANVKTKIDTKTNANDI